MKAFLSGIAGMGMSALAGLFKEAGYEVSGSDTQFYPPVGEILTAMGVTLFSGFDEKNIPADVDVVVLGNVIGRGNPEAEYALDRNLEYYSQAEALYRFFIRSRASVVVAGTHGKTTITAFVAYLLSAAGLDPGFFIGGKPRNFPANYRLGAGDHFVCEGDEYDTSFFDRTSKFLKYRPRFLILSALEYDHADFFPSVEAYLKSFKELVRQVPSTGLIVLNGDFDLGQRAVESACTPIWTYGEKEGDFRIRDLRAVGYGYAFKLEGQGKVLECRTMIPGKYNVWNLTAGILLGLRLGIEAPIIAQACETFLGVERRFQKLNEIGETLFIEDFAHHPTSIGETLQSARESYPGREIVAVFEPRSWSLRRNVFQERLPQSFAPADTVLMMEVFNKEKIPPAERLDVDALAKTLRKEGKTVNLFSEYKTLLDALLKLDFSKPRVVMLLSNGPFGGIPGIIREFKK